MQNIFVYGTLMSESIINKLTGKTFQSLPAILNGYKRYCVNDCDYPAIVPVFDTETKGIVLLNVNDNDLRILSFYEGNEYEQKTVKVSLNNELTDVLAFVWNKEIDLLENKDWDLEHFRKNSLKHYLNFVVPETLNAFYKK